MSDNRKNGKSATGGRFQPGNPGRKPGSRNRVTMACETLLHGQAEALTQRAIELAQSGDTVALRICLDRIIPIRKGRITPLALPAVDTAGGIQAAVTVIVAAVAAGELTAEEAGGVAALLESARRTLETTELEKRIRAIEEHHGKS